MTIELTESQAMAAAALARENGFDTPEAYLHGVLDRHLAGDENVPLNLTEEESDELIALADEALAEGPPTPMTANDWAELRRRVEEKLSAGRVAR